MEFMETTLSSDSGVVLSSYVRGISLYFTYEPGNSKTSQNTYAYSKDRDQSALLYIDRYKAWYGVYSTIFSLFCYLLGSQTFTISRPTELNMKKILQHQLYLFKYRNTRILDVPSSSRPQASESLEKAK